MHSKSKSALEESVKEGCKRGESNMNKGRRICTDEEVVVCCVSLFGWKVIAGRMH